MLSNTVCEKWETLRDHIDTCWHQAFLPCTNSKRWRKIKQLFIYAAMLES